MSIDVDDNVDGVLHLVTVQVDRVGPQLQGGGGETETHVNQLPFPGRVKDCEHGGAVSTSHSHYKQSHPCLFYVSSKNSSDSDILFLSAQRQASDVLTTSNRPPPPHLPSPPRGLRQTKNSGSLFQLSLA